MEVNQSLFFKFSIYCDTTKFGESVHVTGNQINNFAVKDSIELRTCKKVYPHWESDTHCLNIDYNKPFEYKYLIKKGQEIIRWEEIRENRKIPIEYNLEDQSKNLIKVSAGKFGNLLPQILSLEEISNPNVNLGSKNEIIVTEEAVDDMEESDFNKSPKEMEFSFANFEKPENNFGNEMIGDESNNVSPQIRRSLAISARKATSETELNSPLLADSIPLCKSKLSLNNGSSGKNIAMLDYDTFITENPQSLSNKEDLNLPNDELPNACVDNEYVNINSQYETLETKREIQETVVNCDDVQPQREENVDVSPESAPKSLGNEPSNSNNLETVNNEQKDCLPDLFETESNRPDQPLSGLSSPRKKNFKIDLKHINSPDGKYKVNLENKTPNPPQENNQCCCIIV
jgi:hypothetical protein